MDQRALNAIKVGLICGVALILYSLLAYGITEAIFAEMIKPPAPPVPADGPTPTPVGHDSEGMLALIIMFVMLTLGSMFILAAGGALYAWMSRGSQGTIRETIRWSSVAGVFSYIAYFALCVALVIVSAIISLVLFGDLSWVYSGPVSGVASMASTLICCFPNTVIILALGVMSAAIGGFACATIILKQS